ITLISGALNTAGSSGISLNGSAFTQNGTLTTTNNGPIAIINTGTWTQGASIQADGGFTQSGGGSSLLSGSITTTGDNITLASPITLTGAATLSSGGSGGGNISLGSVDGDNDLNLTVGVGNILFNNAVGGGTPIGTLTINSAANVTAGNITARAILQVSGSGTTTFNGNVNTSGAAGISLTGSNFAINGSVIATTSSSGGAISVANTGLLSFGSSANLTIAGSFNQIGSGAVSLQGILLAGGVVSFQGTVSIPSLGLATIDSSSNNSSIQFLHALNGPGAIACSLGSGNLALHADAGTITGLSSLTINNAAIVLTQAITAGSITQTAGSGLSTFNGDLTATGSGGITLTSAAFTFARSATSAGPLSITNAGTLTTAVGQTLSSTGAFSQTGGGSVSLAGTVVTNNQNLSFAGPINLIGVAALSTGSGAGDITLSSTVDGAQDFTMTAGTGNITVVGNIGSNTRLGNIVVVTATNETLATVKASSFTQQALSNQFSLVGTFDTNGPSGISLTGNKFSTQGALITSNGGSLVFLNSGAITGFAGNTANISGQWKQLPGSTGTVNLGGTIVAAGGFIIISPFNSVADVTLDASGGTGGVSIANTVNGANAFTIVAGGGNVSITQPIGASSTLSSLTITGKQIALVNLGGASAGVTGSTSITASGSLQLNGTTYNAGVQTYNASVVFNLLSGALTTISSNGSALNFQNGQILLGAGTNLTMNTSGGSLTTSSIQAGSGSGRSLSLSSGSGNMEVGAIGLAGAGQFASASLSGAIITLDSSLIANTITLNPTTTLNVGGNITSVNTPITFPSAVVFNANSVISTGSGGNITFSSTINGLIPDTQNLTLTAGTGDITFGSTIGNSFATRLNTLMISSARNVSIGDLSVSKFTQLAGSGTTTISGSILTVASQGFQFTGTNLNVQNTASMQTLANGSITVRNSGTFTFAGTANPDGSFVQNTAGLTNFSGSVTTNLGSVSFAGPVVASSVCLMDSSSNNQPITFSSTLNGPGNLTLKAGTGDITLLGNTGATTPLGNTTVVSAGNISIQNFACVSLNAVASGTMQLVGNLSSSGPAGITLVGVNFVRSGPLITTGGGNFVVTNSGTITGTSINTTSIDGSYTQNGTGPVFFAGVITTNNNNISFSSPIILLADGGFDTGAGAGNILLSETINGSSALNFTAGTGDIILNGDLGSITPLGDVTISSTANITAGSITAASITQLSGSDTSTFNGPITTSGSAGINLTAANIIRGSAWTANGTGGITVANSGSFTTTAAGAIQAAGAFHQTDSGPVLIGGSVLTSNAAISFSGPLTLAASVTLNSGSGVGNITISNSVNGAYNLILNSGLGNITTSSAIGSTARLANLTITQAANVNLAAVRAASIVQVGGTGTTTFSGTTNTSALGGISLTGSSFTFSGSVTTTGSGPITISNTGLFTLSAPCTTSGAFNQSGVGTSLLSSSLQATDSIAFTGSVNVSGSASLITSSNPITLSNTLNGPGNLTLNAATGPISLQGAAGNITRLGALTFSAATNITTLGISAASITQTNGSGITTMVGDLNTNSSLGISLMGTNFAITGSLISTNAGPCAISHTSVLSLNAGSSTLLSGPFTESGVGGTVNLSGTIHASNANVTFTNPILLTGAATLNSNEGGDILVSSTVDGPYDLVYTAGTGNITLAANIGSITPVNSLTITTANNVSTQAISAGSINQNEGSGSTIFNGALVSTQMSGINLTGTAFTFEAPVTTIGGGSLVINNSGALILPSAAPISLQGNFSQTGSGAVSLATSIEMQGTQLLFTAPITLTGASNLDMDGLSGILTLSNTVNGAQNLIIESDTGSIVLSGVIGGTTPLSLFQVTECTTLTANAIHASQINILDIGSLATLNGPLSTTGASGITLSGASFNVNGNIATTGGGPLAITNSSLVTISPALVINLSGPFTQTGLGTTNIGGTLTTAGFAIHFSGPINLTGDLSLHSNNGNVTLQDDIEGAHSLSITAGSGDVTVAVAFSLATALQNFTVVSSHDISLNGIGSPTSIMTGALSLTASDMITLANGIYAAHVQTYQSSADTDFVNMGIVTLLSNGGPITLASGAAHLNSGTNLVVQTQGGEFSFNVIHGTDFENLTISTGSGLASLGLIPNIGHLNTVTVNAGSILLNNTMELTNLSLTSQHSILNAAGPVEITSANDAFFNAVGGNVGSLSSPILVDTSQQIIAGASGGLADFNGSSIDNTVHVYLPNPPCVIYFNGVKIKDCGGPPPPPPSPAAPQVRGLLKGSRFFAVIGVYDSQFTFANDYFFLTYILDEKYWIRSVPMFVPRQPLHTEFPALQSREFLSDTNTNRNK
ncbi:MAG: hypothetical protein IT584_03035, partial [Chlamydiae bacterium]|nr:hypothetical protein [Chlamydiota bacterium]